MHLIFCAIFLFFYSFYIQGYSYDPQYYEISLQRNTPTGVVVVAYNRPDYFKRVIESIERNPEASSLPFFFMLDGGPSAKQEENAKIIQNSIISHKYIILRDENYGCAKNLIDARRFMFDWCKFEKVIVMEDDLIVTPQYFGLLERLHRWATENYDNVGVVQTWNYCFLSVDEKRERLQDVIDSGYYWWSFVSYCIDRSAWNRISPILYEYESRFIDTLPQSPQFFKQRSKPGLSNLAPEIRQWIKKLIKQRQVSPLFPDRQFRVLPIDLESFFSSDAFEPNQDLMTGFALWMAGMIKVQTIVNRAKHIGEIGITFTNDIQWRDFGFDKITLDEFEEDQQFTHFREWPPRGVK